MTKKEKRIAVITDALKWIKRKSVNVRTSFGYLIYDNDLPSEFVGRSLQGELRKLITASKPCSVCAKGALFLAHVDRFNKVTINSDSQIMNEDPICEPLLKEFSSEQLDLVEACFEDLLNSAKGRLLRNPFDQYHNPQKRLEMILKSMLENDGELILPEGCTY